MARSDPSRSELADCRITTKRLGGAIAAVFRRHQQREWGAAAKRNNQTARGPSKPRML
eukprot:CAMPEP_0174856006 /NCGR_PEP_ID=MMETSP1114-20130205/34852_1 /TAXON_ID=312471 /ORGANISM="Neobodo designis, Strain CCAP 1951/1" /LENGTH=57 /DNA_ID=CAMNT_0016090781 /DNA_START=38 /DNA_END=208 /DNA_ORIENTATION=-